MITVGPFFSEQQVLLLVAVQKLWHIFWSTRGA